MQYYCPDSFDPKYNLALEESLFNTDFSENILMLWQNKPSIIIGRNQNLYNEIDSQIAESKNIQVVRRITGGGAVYHDLGNLNFSFIQSKKDKNSGFSYFIEPIVQSLQALGLKASLSGRNDICIDGVKISGNAQFKNSKNVLHHGTILLKADLSILGQCLKPDPEKYLSKAVNSVRSRVGNLCDFLPELTIEKLKKTIQEHCQVTSKLDLSPELLAQAQDLAQNKYSSFLWNYGKSPKYSLSNKKRFSFGTLEYFFLVEQGLIQDCQLVGDFFSQNSQIDLCQILQGQKYTRQSLIDCLKPELLNQAIMGAEAQELLEFFLEKI